MTDRETLAVCALLGLAGVLAAGDVALGLAARAGRGAAMFALEVGFAAVVMAGAAAEDLRRA